MIQIVDPIVPGAALAYMGTKREDYLSFSAIAQQSVVAASGRLPKIGRVTVPELRGSPTYTLSNLGVSPIGSTPWASLTTTVAALWALQENKFAIRYGQSDVNEWRAMGLNPDQIVLEAATNVLMAATEVVTVALMTSTSALPGAARATIWTSASADPRDDVNTAVNAIQVATGIMDRRLISIALSVAAFQVLSKHPALLTYHALPNLGTPTVLGTAELALALGVGKVRVASATWNGVADGITPAGAFIWPASNDEVCVYLDLPSVAGVGAQPAFARFARQGADFVPNLIQNVDHGVHSLAIMAEQQLANVDVNAAYLIEGVLA